MPTNQDTQVLEQKQKKDKKSKIELAKRVQLSDGANEPEDYLSDDMNQFVNEDDMDDALAGADDDAYSN